MPQVMLSSSGVPGRDPFPTASRQYLSAFSYASRLEMSFFLFAYPSSVGQKPREFIDGVLRLAYLVGGVPCLHLDDIRLLL